MPKRISSDTGYLDREPIDAPVRTEPRVLLFDFETSPLVGWGWRLYDSPMFHVEQDVMVISVAWTWLDDDEVYAMGIHEFKGYKPGIRNVNDKKLIQEFMKVFERADVVIAQNGFGFDFRLFRTRMLVNGIKPHHEPKELDTKRFAKSKFLFTSNSQDNITRQLGEGRKMKTAKDLHYDVLEVGSAEKWKEMIDYNKQDVVGLKVMAKALAPYVTIQVNRNVYSGEAMGCPNIFCKGKIMHHRGTRPTLTGIKMLYRCSTCGKSATAKNVPSGVLLS